MMIKDMAVEVLNSKVIPYVRYNTLTAKQHYFMCMFGDSPDFGINLLNIEVDLVVKYLEETDHYVLNKIKSMIIEEIGFFKEVYLIYFILYHEEGHWLEFLESGLDPITYCKTIDLSGYKGALTHIGRDIKEGKIDKQTLLNEYDWQYRSNPYEKRADLHALKRLKNYHEKNKNRHLIL